MIRRSVLASMLMIATFSTLGCARRARVQYAVQYAQQEPVYQPVQQQHYEQPSGYQVSGEAHLLYLPGVSGLIATMVQSIVVQSHDGQVFQLGAADLQPALAGRLALRLPSGVTSGTVTLYAMGQQVSVPFHVAVMMGGELIGSAPPSSNPACAAIAGSWVGSITDQPGASSVVELEILGDCQTVRGFVHLEAPGTGSVDSTVDGTWDPHQYRLVARDTQLFNVVAQPGGSFCPTARYDLQMQQDGSLVGQNIVTEAPCRGTSPVYLRRP